MALSYATQVHYTLYGTKNPTTFAISAPLTLTSYYKSSAAKIIPTQGASKLELIGIYTAGASETANSVQITVQSSSDAINFGRVVNDSTSGGTSTLTPREFSVAQVTDTGTLAYTSQTVNFTAGLKITGGTSAATGYIESDADGGTTGTLTLSNVTGTFQTSETITDSGSGSATTNGILTSITKFSLPLDISSHYILVNVKETGVASNAGTLYLESIVSGR